ncbi:MAG TPA: NAD(P)/FAD-dependent oxidoreductase [Candidatus Fimenecus excrementigallinarum]|uniref:NAD(P)/FAD-dependent oxidoreductase n=1 Tax=Candidatus Fimenecus excrementigallinarum TaxID=2840816 RepID=A0A9D1IGG6_9FIRM|nr:NAD(P)/FAD-dependent oxidoreductase [Candidatus Fimenecus excrementigallinarum]
MKFDVAVIGGGVIGALIARALSRTDLRVALLEKCNDVAMGTTKANSAIVHGGFDAANGTLKAKLNVRGTALMPALCKTLNVPYRNNGSLVLAFSDEEMQHVRALYERGQKNGVPKLSVLDGDAVRQLEPHVSGEVVGALLSETAGIVCPYELTIAATENAVENGVEFYRNCCVTGMDKLDGGFCLQTTRGEIEAGYVVNAAGIHADEIARMIGDDSITLVARKGEYYLLDKAYGYLADHTIFQCPNKMGKGVLVTPTVDGNLLIGPSALDVEDKEDVDTTADGLSFVFEKAKRSVPELTLRGAITSFAGMRAHPTSDDFIIGFSEKSDRFLHVAGIESPGLSAAPAIAEMVYDLLCARIEPRVRADFRPERPAPVRFRHLSKTQREALVAKNKAYGRVICRCETITEGEILDAIHAPAGARDVDGVKRRTRAGMGRCQGGFCGSKVVEILARELNVPINEITKFGGDSKILFDKTK